MSGEAWDGCGVLGLFVGLWLFDRSRRGASWMLALIACLVLGWRESMSAVAVWALGGRLLGLAVVTAIPRHLQGRDLTLWRDAAPVGRMAVMGLSGGLAGAVAVVSAGSASGVLDYAVCMLTCTVVSAVADGASRRGSSALTSPLALAAALTLVMTTAAAEQSLSLGAIVLASLVLGWVTWRLRLLTLGGAAGSVLVGVFLFGAAGWSGAAPLLAFFLLSSGLSKAVDRVRGKEQDAKGSVRDIVQVFANGGAATLCAVGGMLGLLPQWYLGVVGALAAAAADTWATDMGRLAGWTPRRITTGEPVAVGTSGGVTLPGFLGSVLGAAMVVTVASPWLGRSDLMVQLVGVGVVSAALDSVFGDTIQARYRRGDGVVREHVEGEAEVVRGVGWVDNDAVNGLMTCVGAALAMFLQS